VLVSEGKGCTQSEIRLWNTVPRSVQRTIYVLNIHIWEAMGFIHTAYNKNDGFYEIYDTSSCTFFINLCEKNTVEYYRLYTSEHRTKEVIATYV
jgi:hypothetical protein